MTSEGHSSSNYHCNNYYLVIFLRHLSLTGNDFQCKGASELLKATVAVCEADSEYRPPLAHLNLQDNGIDCLGLQGMVEPVHFIRLLKRSIHVHTVYIHVLLKCKVHVYTCIRRM